MKNLKSSLKKTVKKAPKLGKYYFVKCNPFNKNPPFVVTGMPRSGTMYLARTLNHSSKYNVSHDLHVDTGHAYLRTGKNIYLRRLNRTLNICSYGDVSGVHRRYLLELSVPNKAIIIREPMAVLNSHLNMSGGPEEVIKKLKDQSFASDFRMLMSYVKDFNIAYFRFEDLVSDRLEVLRLANYVGIEDIPGSSIDIQSKVNSRPQLYSVKNLEPALVENFRDDTREYVDFFGYKLL